MEQGIELYCRACNTLCQEGDAFCFHCGYSFHATLEEQNAFVLERAKKKKEREALRKYIKQGKIILIILSVLCFLVSIAFVAKIIPTEGPYLATAIGLFILSMVYALLAWWSSSRPFAATLAGLILYAMLFLFEVVGNPSLLWEGGFWRILIIVLLVRAMQGARKYELSRKEEKYD